MYYVRCPARNEGWETRAQNKWTQDKPVHFVVLSKIPGTDSGSLRRAEDESLTAHFPTITTFNAQQYGCWEAHRWLLVAFHT